VPTEPDRTETESHSDRYKLKATPLTAAERQRQRRAKIVAVPVLHGEFKAKESARWHRRVQSHNVKLIADITPREQRQQQRHWRKKWKERINKKSFNSSS